MLAVERLDRDDVDVLETGVSGAHELRSFPRLGLVAVALELRLWLSGQSSYQMPSSSALMPGTIAHAGDYARSRV
ncbi:MAG: hypothetical protein M3P18_01015, partial [Actinomycetota bacterium]|nr:hypothetical protein [Actinomycetota bacterium]